MLKSFTGERKMAIKSGILLLTLLVGCLAIPTQPQDDMSVFYEHVDPTARIVGGTEAFAGAHPHMVAMSSGALIRSFLCGGSLITNRSVLTAAHCIAAVFSWGSLSSSLRVTVGTNRWNSGGTTYSLSRNVTHPNYVSSTIKNDLGLLITAANVVFTPLISAIPLNYNHVPSGVACRVAGWGRIATNGALSNTLLELLTWTYDEQRCVAEVPVVATQLNLRPPPVEPHIEICTYHAPGRATCNGDSGSALVRVDQGQQIGIVSWGLPCGRGAPDMFVRVSAYRDWLLNNIV